MSEKLDKLRASLEKERERRIKINTRIESLGKGAQLGTVLAFMMGVTTLSLPSMIMLRKAVKPKLLGVFIAICALGIIVVGYLFNLFQGFIL